MKTIPQDRRKLCADCYWVDETDSVAKTSFKGVGLCRLHAAVPEMLEMLRDIAYEPEFRVETEDDREKTIFEIKELVEKIDHTLPGMKRG